MTFDGVGDHLGGVIGMLAVVDHEALVALGDQRQHLGAQFVVCERAPHDLGGFGAKTAVDGK